MIVSPLSIRRNISNWHNQNKAANSGTKKWSTIQETALQWHDRCIHQNQSTRGREGIIFGVNQFSIDHGDCDCNFGCFSVAFGRRFCGKQHMERSNSAHTTRWRNLRPKKVFYTIEMGTNASGAMFCWLWQVTHSHCCPQSTHMDEWFVVFVPNLAGAVSSAIATPTDVLKVRMQVHGRGTDKIGLIGCFREIYQYEGISGLWRVRIEWIWSGKKFNGENRMLMICLLPFITRAWGRQHKEVAYLIKCNTTSPRKCSESIDSFRFPFQLLLSLPLSCPSTIFVNCICSKHSAIM